MATVSSVTLNADGTATTGAGDTLIGTVEDHVKEIAHRLAAKLEIAYEDAVKLAEKIVGEHTVVAVENAVQSEVESVVAPASPAPAPPADVVPTA